MFCSSMDCSVEEQEEPEGPVLPPPVVTGADTTGVVVVGAGVLGVGVGVGVDVGWLPPLLALDGRG